MSEVAAALAVCRFGQDAAAMLLWGGSVYLWALVPRGLACSIMRRLRPWMVAAVSVEAVTTLAKLPAEVAAIGDGWRDAVDPAMVGSVLRDTSVGQAWGAQAAAAVLLVGVAVSRRAYPIGTAGASELLLAGLGLTGHASIVSSWPTAGAFPRWPGCSSARVSRCCGSGLPRSCRNWTLAEDECARRASSFIAIALVDAYLEAAIGL